MLVIFIELEKINVSYFVSYLHKFSGIVKEFKFGHSHRSDCIFDIILDNALQNKEVVTEQQ